MSLTKTNNADIPTSKVLDAIRLKREEVKMLLIKAASGSPPSVNSSMRLLNDRLANTLSLAFLKGRPLVKLHALRSPEELFRLFEKPVTEQEYFSTMSELIEEDELGKNNPEIRKTAIDLIRNVVKQYLTPTAKTPISLSSIYDLGAKPVDPDHAESIDMLCKAAEVQARAIFEFVRLRINYLSEGGENLQRALHTLLVGGGDCDDLAILTGSLLRSLGFSIYLKFIPGHVFAGVFLPELKQAPVSSLPPEAQKNMPMKMTKQGKIHFMEYWAVPLDIRQFHLETQFQERADFDVFDIYNGEYDGILRTVLNSVAEHVENKDDKKIKQALDEFMSEPYFGKLIKQIANICGESGKYCITDGYPHLLRAKDIGVRFHEQNMRVFKPTEDGK